MRGSYNFVLKGLTYERYLEESTKHREDDIIVISETPVEFTDLGVDEKHCHNFVDVNKTAVKLIPVLLDNEQLGYPINTQANCWSCRSKFYGPAWGCPLEYSKVNKGSKEYDSVMKVLKCRNIKPTEDSIDFFYAEGIMCSKECVKTYILEKLSMHNGSAKYSSALTLLSLLVKRMTGEDNADIVPRHDIWKLSKEWGGKTDMEDLRESTASVEFIETVNIRRPLLYSNSQYIRECRIGS
jgi:hypothetical protein